MAERLRLMKLRQEQEREREAKLCVICLDVAKDAVLMPCAHVCVCAGCAAVLAVGAAPRRQPLLGVLRFASRQRVFV